MHNTYYNNSIKFLASAIAISASLSAAQIAGESHENYEFYTEKNTPITLSLPYGPSYNVTGEMHGTLKQTSINYQYTPEKDYDQPINFRFIDQSTSKKKQTLI